MTCDGDMVTPARDYSDVEYVFEPHSPAMPNLREYAAALWERRRFMVALAGADLRAARARTRLGDIWSVLDPLFMAAIYFFLFTVLRGGARAAFLPMLIGNIFLFSLTTAALTDGGSAIKRSKSLMLNSTFPRALLPLTTVYKAYRKFALMALVYVVIFPLVGGNFGPGLFVLPLLFAIHFVMNVGIALLVCTFVTLNPDASNLMAYVGRILFFATPIIYPVTLLPPGAKMLVGWQPLFGLFSGYQTIFSGGVPSPASVIQAALWAVALFVIGVRVFLRRERKFAIDL